MPAKDWKKDVFTIPNMLSMFRILLIPVYVVIYLGGNYLLAAGILAISCFTDLLDGQIARRFNMISTTGKILDPLADKATQLTMIICLLLKHPQLTIVIVFFVCKELFQLISAAIMLRKGIVLKGALLTGKISTTVVFLSLIAMVLLPDLEAKHIQIIALVDSAVMLIAMVDYARAFYTDNPMRQTIEEELSNK